MYIYIYLLPAPTRLYYTDATFTTAHLPQRVRDHLGRLRLALGANHRSLALLLRLEYRYIRYCPRTPAALALCPQPYTPLPSPALYPQPYTPLPSPVYLGNQKFLPLCLLLRHLFKRYVSVTLRCGRGRTVVDRYKSSLFSSSYTCMKKTLCIVYRGKYILQGKIFCHTCFFSIADAYSLPKVRWVMEMSSCVAPPTHGTLSLRLQK
jgi:hypothetical protein